MKGYFQRGFALKRQLLAREDILSLQDALRSVIASSAGSTSHTDAFDVAPGHSPDSPRIRKVKRPHLVHDAFAAVVHHPALLDLAQAVVATHSPPAVRFQGAKLNIKTACGGAPVAWHQDWAFYPHTNDDLCTISIPLVDVTRDMGCLRFLPGSHRGPLFSHHRGTQFVGGIVDNSFDASAAVDVECEVGDVIIHHVRTVHGSKANRTDTDRPMLFLQYAAVDAWPLQQHDRGAWGEDRRAGDDEWAAFTRSIVRLEGGVSPPVRPRMTAVPVSVPLQWPARGSVGALYRQLEKMGAEGYGNRSAVAGGEGAVGGCTPGGWQRVEAEGQNLEEGRAADGRKKVVGTAVGRMEGEGRKLHSPASLRSVSRGVESAVHSGLESDPSPPPASHQQFEYVYRRRSDDRAGELWQRLLQFVGAGPYGFLYEKGPMERDMMQGALAALCSQGMDDDAVYDGLNDIFHQHVVPSPAYQRVYGGDDREDTSQPPWHELRARGHAYDIAAEVARHDVDVSSAPTLLDIGCGDGSIGAALAAILGEKGGRLLGCDVHRHNRLPENMAFSLLPRLEGEWVIGSEACGPAGEVQKGSSHASVLPYEGSSADVAIACMSMHHVRHQEELLRDVARVLRPGGVFVIRDHDCHLPGLECVLDIVHGLHCRVWPARGAAGHRPLFAHQHRARYRSQQDWNRLCQSAGLIRPTVASAPAQSISPSAGAAFHGGEMVHDWGRLQRVHFPNLKRVFYGVYVKSASS